MGVFDVDYNKITERTQFPYEIEVIHHTWITMSDGTRLSAKIWKPKTDDKTKGAVLEYLPYRKDEFTALRDEIRHKYFAGFGYTAIRVDIRGTGDSEGIIEDEYPLQEQDDAIDIINWITSQQWSNGSVAMIGKSWGGFNGLQVAARQPEALKTIISLCSTDDRYADDVHYKGGTLMASDMLWWASTMFAYNARPAFPKYFGDKWYENWLERLEQTPPFVEEWVSHQTRDDYWKHGSINEDYSDIKIPVLTMSGWADGYTNAVFRLMENLNVPKKGIIGPWAHEFPDVAIPGPQFGYLQEVVSWLDKWMQQDSTIDHQDEFLVYLQDSVEPKTSYDYREGKWFDLLKEETTKKDLLSSMTRVISLKNNQQHGLYSGVFCPFGQEGDLPDDQTIDNALASSFMLDTFGETLNIIGQPVAKLHLKSDSKFGNIHVRITDVHPDGHKTLVTMGQLNLNHYKSHETPEDLPVNEFINVEVPLDVIGYQIPAGHTIEISIAPAYWPQIWPSREVANIVVDLEYSHLELPLVDNFEEVQLNYQLSETAQPLEKIIHREGSRTRDITKRLTTNEWVLRDYSDEGLRTLKESNITYGTENLNLYTITEGDPLTAKVQCDWKVIVKDDDIDTEVETYSTMTCDVDYYYLYNKLVAYNDGVQCFTKTWHKKIKRNYS
ncbi:CocE/NonD family hydrolase [Mammaliicoccus fleurettii]|uniref:CocE/NonD family hydrolase n=1 Tax=Mammaliicoccus fleurettii TaxID=150056 RepID=A0ABS5MM19_9STAP|nr:CocE/NonD family hydrolase [Mammaliicoccus fleurettii]MBL0847210.1 CocE/NonD family hydrolase [Mammaliicoccus fleurettii]MBS3672144.1 CocE/NonD family hydrolase [Mammaliicoccus fleurettii]MBS3696960.1 CocE/NonD family hydrolase [Mammaliicoccus fleurettii]